MGAISSILAASVHDAILIPNLGVLKLMRHFIPLCN